MPTPKYLVQNNQRSTYTDYPAKVLMDIIEARHQRGSYLFQKLEGYVCFKSHDERTCVIIRDNPVSNQEELICLHCYEKQIKEATHTKATNTILRRIHLISKDSTILRKCRDCRLPLLTTTKAENCNDCMAEFITHTDHLDKNSTVMVTNQISEPTPSLTEISRRARSSKLKMTSGVSLWPGTPTSSKVTTDVPSGMYTTTESTRSSRQIKNHRSKPTARSRTPETPESTVPSTQSESTDTAKEASTPEQQVMGRNKVKFWGPRSFNWCTKCGHGHDIFNCSETDPKPYPLHFCMLCGWGHHINDCPKRIARERASSNN